MKKVFVGMSGGVDSSVAAMLLKKQGYDVVGVFMRSYNLDGCAERDAEDARRVAEKLGIPFYSWDFEEEYKRRVVDYMIEGYKAGITPNPDVMCNKEIKFGLFLDKAIANGADLVATGHYVRIDRGDQAGGEHGADGAAVEPIKLFAAKDPGKDQSYFLWTLTQQQLSRCLFPIGDYLKSEVRDMAREAGLPTAEKKDSQGICFLGKVSLEDFLKEYIPSRRGKLVSTAGEILGEHSGAEFYTIGQRHINAEFKFPKTAQAGRKPFYVASKDREANTVVLAEGENNPALFRNGVDLANMNFISGRNFFTNSGGSLSGPNIEVFARVRYRQPLFRSELSVVIPDDRGARCHLEFSEPMKFVAPGQSAVFYSAEGEMLGGGVIL